MNLNVAEIKSEAVKLPLICRACFSVDRTLRPVGNLLDVFCSLLETRIVRIGSVCLCWECLALLRRFSDFKRNVSTVQSFLQNYQSNQNIPIPQPLTRLNTVRTKHEDLRGVCERKTESPDTDIKNEMPSAPLLAGFQLKHEIGEGDDDKLATAHGWQDDADVVDSKDPAQTSLSDWPRNRKTARRTTNKKYTKRTESDLCLKDYYRTVPVDSASLDVLFKQDRKDDVFLRYPHRCEKCVRGWREREQLVLHNKKYHAKSAGSFKCDICSSRAASKAALARHVGAHSARQCAACSFRCAAPARMRRHVLEKHVQTVQCLSCSASFYNVREFFDHYKSLHRQFVCDHCGKRYVSRASIKKHLANHGPFVCRECDGQVFKTRDSLGAHRRLKHSSLPRPELAYCVECDRQFDSVRAYRMHLADNDAHRKNARKRHFPCPTCGKVYVRNAYMRAHHNLVHLQRSDFCCSDCDASFVNRAQYVLHVKMKHEGYTRPKNKLCPVCGRGFTRNWYLRNHLRTHTGERPFACGHCDASFGQRAAMKAHERHIHLKGKS